MDDEVAAGALLQAWISSSYVVVLEGRVVMSYRRSCVDQRRVITLVKEVNIRSQWDQLLNEREQQPREHHMTMVAIINVSVTQQLS